MSECLAEYKLKIAQFSNRIFPMHSCEEEFDIIGNCSYPVSAETDSITLFGIKKREKRNKKHLKASLLNLVCIEIRTQNKTLESFIFSKRNTNH